MNRLVDLCTELMIMSLQQIDYSCSTTQTVHITYIYPCVRLYSHRSSYFASKKGLEEVSDLNSENFLNAKVIVYSKNGKIFQKSRFYTLKQAILRPDSFQVWDLILFPGLFRFKITWLKPREQKFDKISENRIALGQGRAGMYMYSCSSSCFCCWVWVSLPIFLTHFSFFFFLTH